VKILKQQQQKTEKKMKTDRKRERERARERERRGGRDILWCQRYEMFGQCPQHLRAVLWDFRDEGSVWDLVTHHNKELLFAASANGSLAAFNVKTEVRKD